MRDIQVAAQEFARKIWIDMPRIQKGNAITQFIPLLRELRYLGVTLGQKALVFTPGQNSARSRKRKAAQKQKANKRHTLNHAFARQPGFGAGLFHACHRITVNPVIQADFRVFRHFAMLSNNWGG